MEDKIRKLAKSSYFQNCYVHAKEFGTISLFKNTTNLSKIQIFFLHWLSVYNSLYQDLANEEDYLSEKVIDDDIRADAYLLWKSKMKDKNNTKKDEDTDNSLGIPKVIFKSKGKKK